MYWLNIIQVKDKKSVYIKYYSSKDHKINSTIKKKIPSNFEFFQIIALSSSGNMLSIVSIFGNKIHIYNTQDEKLKYCIYLGPTIQVIENVFPLIIHLSYTSFNTSSSIKLLLLIFLRIFSLTIV